MTTATANSTKCQCGRYKKAEYPSCYECRFKTQRSASIDELAIYAKLDDAASRTSYGATDKQIKYLAHLFNKSERDTSDIIEDIESLAELTKEFASSMISDLLGK